MNVRALINEAKEHETNKRYQFAISAYEKARALYPKPDMDLYFALANCHFNYGYFLKNAGRYRLAIQQFRDATCSFPDDTAENRRLIALSHYQIALCYVKVHLVGYAIDPAQQAVILFLNTEIEKAGCYYVQGIIYRAIGQSIGDYTQAIKFFEKAKELMEKFHDDNGIANCDYQLAQIRYLERDYPSVIYRCNAAIESSGKQRKDQPDLEIHYLNNNQLSIDSYYLQCQAYQHLQQHALAIQGINKILTFQISDSFKANCLKIRGNSYLAEKDYPAALQDFQQAFIWHSFFYFNEEELNNIAKNHHDFYEMLLSDPFMSQVQFSRETRAKLPWPGKSTTAGLISTLGTLEQKEAGREMTDEPEPAVASREVADEPKPVISNLMESPTQEISASTDSQEARRFIPG